MDDDLVGRQFTQLPQSTDSIMGVWIDVTMIILGVLVTGLGILPWF
ncbi:MAG: hypothetical protein R3B96_01685 [Pirellulaceae bacterium]|nr:hypothetical protein [Planctomycetales bacterium]